MTLAVVNATPTYASSVTDDAVIWTPDVVARVATIVVIMAATIVGNTSLIVGITCNAALRRRRVSVFLINLAVADLMVCVVTMTTEILFVAFGQWVLGAAACKLAVYGQIVTLACTTFLLTAMSIDSYQVWSRSLSACSRKTDDRPDR
jgi:neuropeptide S receptor 1